MKGAMVWVAYGVFSLCMVASVASYLWSSDFFWWPMLFSVVGMAVILPVIFGPSIRAIIGAFRTSHPLSQPLRGTNEPDQD